MTYRKGRDRAETKQPQDLILVGIFQDPENGILMIQSPQGQLQLPGGKIHKTSNWRFTNRQLNREITKIRKVIFEKSGLLFDVKCLIALYDIKGKFYKIFLLSQSTTPLNNLPWQRNLNYHAIYILADIDTILSVTDIPYEDGQILIDYLSKGIKIIEGQNLTCEVKYIA